MIRVSVIMTMMNKYAFVAILLAGAAIRSEALVAPRYCKSRYVPSTTQHHRNRIPVGSPRKAFPSFGIHNNRYRPQHQPPRGRTTLLSSATLINGDGETDTDESPVNEFQPRTMKVSQSFTFFSQFVVKTILDKRAQKTLGRENRRRLRDRLKRVLLHRKVKKVLTTKKKKGAKKTGIRANMRKLNESRKKLILLVGYDSSLLVPAFSYLIMGAFMSSVIPHYYSACISCVAAGEANRNKLLWALGGLGLSHVLEAVFTGFRGALFWIAGESTPAYLLGLCRYRFSMFLDLYLFFSLPLP